MNLKEYQTRSSLTDQNPQAKDVELTSEYTAKQRAEIIPLLGLVGEVGGLLSEYKKMIRDGNKHQEFRELVAEELGDILWYVSTVATNFDLDLEKIANENLAKTQDRWHEPDNKGKLYDHNCHINQQFPRNFSYMFSHADIKGVQKLVLTDTVTGENIGDPLTDNAYDDDGYRYHDVIHLAFVAYFGWSPIFRKLFRDKGIIKSKRAAAVDEAEDGGRAKVIEEAIIAAAYVYADQHNFLDGIEAVDWKLIRHIQQMTAKLEVKDRKAWEWNKVLLQGFRVWRKLIEHKGGIVEGDLLTGNLTFRPIPQA